MHGRYTEEDIKNTETYKAYLQILADGLLESMVDIWNKMGPGEDDSVDTLVKQQLNPTLVNRRSAKELRLNNLSGHLASAVKQIKKKEAEFKPKSEKQDGVKSRSTSPEKRTEAERSAIAREAADRRRMGTDFPTLPQVTAESGSQNGNGDKAPEETKSQEVVPPKKNPFEKAKITVSELTPEERAALTQTLGPRQETTPLSPKAKPVELESVEIESIQETSQESSEEKDKQ